MVKWKQKFRLYFIYLSIFMLSFSTIDVFTVTKVIANEEVAMEQNQKSSEQGNTNNRIEIPSLRTETSKVYGNADGTYTAEVMMEPVHFKNGETWEPIDNTLVSLNNGEEIGNKQNKFKVKFPKKPKQNGKTTLFTYELAGKKVTLGLYNQSNKKDTTYTGPKDIVANQADGKFIYTNIFDGVTFEYQVEGSKVKENIILDSYQGKNSFEFFLEAKGLKAEKQANGRINFTDEQTGEFLFYFERPYMFDSSADSPAESDFSQEVTQDVTQVDGGFLITLVADEAYLTDPSRVYPVTIDPWVDMFNSEDTYIAQNYPNINYHNSEWLYIGNYTGNNSGPTRAILKWPNLPVIPNAEILDAKVGISQYISHGDATINLHRLTGPYNDIASVNWSNAPSFSPTVESSQSTFSNNGYPEYFNVTNLVKSWYSGTAPNYGVLLKYNNESIGSKVFRSNDWINPDGTLNEKPKLVITYRPKELLGITDYWKYTPDLFQGEGDAVVNVINGNLVYDIGILSLSSKSNAFQMQLVYNNRSTFQDAFGYGWTLSAQRRLIIPNDKNVIEYIDENGTRLHFNKHQEDIDTTYSSPEGNYLELSSTSTGYSIKQPDETILTFDSLGRNTKVQDEKGNAIFYSFDGNSSRIIKINEGYKEQVGRGVNLTYNSSGYLEKITDFRSTETVFSYNEYNSVKRLGSITFAANRPEKKQIAFSYTNLHQLKEVIDANGNKGTFEYDTSNRVQKIIDPRSTSMFAQLSYPSPSETIYTDAKGNKTYFKHAASSTGATINVVEEKENYQTPEETTTKYEWSKNTMTKVIEPNPATGSADGTVVHTASYDNKGNETSTQSPNSITTNTTYDGKSNVTSETSLGTTYEYVYDSKSNEVNSWDNYKITDYSTYNSFGYETSSVSGTRFTHNRLQNSNFERQDSAGQGSNWGTRAVGQYSLSTDHILGKKSAQITLSSNDGAGYYTQTIPVQSDEFDKTYTYSAYIKTSNVIGTGAQLRIYPLDANHQYLYDNSGQVIKYHSQAIKGTNDWIRVSDFVTLPVTTVNVKVDLLVTGTGTAKFDGVQLLYGRTLDQYYSNEYGSMEWELDTTTDYTKLFSLGTNDGRTTERARRGSYSYKLNGVSTQSRYFGQYVDVQGKAGDPLTLSGWIYAQNPNKTGLLELRLWFMYADGTESSYSIPADQSIVNQWQFVKKTFRAEKDFTKAKVYGVYKDQTGTAYFDNVKLEEHGSTSADEYSADGNFKEKSINELNHSSTYKYDLNGNQVSTTDEVGKTTKFTYDFLNRLKSTVLVKSSETDPENIVISYDYDTQGNLKTRTESRGFKTVFSYNATNDVTRETDPLNKFIRYDYDANGNLTLVERGKVSNSVDNIVAKIENKYDSKNRLTTKIVGGETLYSYGYDKANNVTSITVKGKETYSFNYDTNKQITSAKEPGGYLLENTYKNDVKSPNHGLRESYKETVDSINNPTNSEVTKYSYDILKRLTSVENTKGNKTEFFYDESNQPIRIRNGATNFYLTYDETGKVVQQTSIGTKTLNLVHSYFPNGNLKTISNGTKTDTFTYDFAGRVETWNNGVTTVSYSYDKSGNLLNPNSKSLTFNGANEVNGFTYDDAGNVTKDDKYQYQWDQEGRLIDVKNLSGTLLASYTYHPDGLRKTKTVGANTYHYHYDGSNLIRITDQNKATLWTITWANGKPVSFTNKAGVTYFYVTNYRGDVIQIVDQNGVEVASYSYDPWGKVLSTNENTDVTGQPLGYASYVYDRETKLYYLQARYYDPETARFISRDPDPGDSDDPKTQNGYTYADNNPVMLVDPDGHFAWLAINAAFAAYDGYNAYKSGASAMGVVGAVGLGLIGGSKLKLAKKVSHSVYTLSKGGKVVYVGRTRNISSRKYTHSKTHGDTTFNVVRSNLSYSQARGLEHRLYLKNGGKKNLRNKIRPISKKNKKYKHYMSSSRKIYR